jgi:epoxyqueuosine reductase
MSLTALAVKARARELGFDLCGVAAADRVPELTHFTDWIARGYAGEMHYLARTADKRTDVRRVLPSARSVIVLGTLYNVDRPYSTEIADTQRALISRYAWGDDYHQVIGRRLDALVAWMREAHGEAFDARAYVDTGPVQERAFAQRAGLGWIGKNTCLIHPGLGSFLFLSEVICSVALAPDEAGLDRCGTCTLCLDACPTGAFAGPGVLDARRCLSYLTIELKGPIPEVWHEAIGSRVYGCDICQEVCPWNQAAPRSGDPAWQPRPAFDGVAIGELASRSDEELRAAMKGSAMKRTGVGGLRRTLDAIQRQPHRTAAPGG